MKKGVSKFREKIIFGCAKTGHCSQEVRECSLEATHISKEPILQNANFRNRQTLFYLTEVDC